MPLTNNAIHESVRKCCRQCDCGLERMVHRSMFNATPGMPITVPHKVNPIKIKSLGMYKHIPAKISLCPIKYKLRLP